MSISLRPHGPYSIEFSRPKHWSGEPFPSPRDRPYPGIKSMSSTLQVDSLPAEPQGKPFESENSSHLYVPLFWYLSLE